MHSGIRHFEFVDEFPAALYRSTLEGTLLYCNRRYAEILGHGSPVELIGSAEAELYRNKTDRGRLLERLQQHRVVVDLPVTFRRRDGSDLVCAVTARGTCDDDGVMVHVDGMLREPIGGTAESAPALEGLQETASGAVQGMNRPLTAVSRQVQQLLVELDADAPLFDRIVAIQQQINRLIEITQGIAGTPGCEWTGGVAGMKTIDGDKAAR